MAEKRRERFVCEQPPYSISSVASRRRAPDCEQYGVGVIPWSPLAGGWLTGTLSQGPPRSFRASGRQRIPHRVRLSPAEEPAQARRRESLAPLAEGPASPDPPSLAFVLQPPAVTSAIIGPRTLEHLASQLGAVDVELDSTCSTESTRSSTEGTTIQPDRRGLLPPALRTTRSGGADYSSGVKPRDPLHAGDLCTAVRHARNSFVASGSSGRSRGPGRPYSSRADSTRQYPASTSRAPRSGSRSARRPTSAARQEAEDVLSRLHVLEGVHRDGLRVPRPGEG